MNSFLLYLLLLIDCSFLARIPTRTLILRLLHPCHLLSVSTPYTVCPAVTIAVHAPHQAQQAVRARRIEEQLYADAHAQFDMASRLRGTAMASRPAHTKHVEGRNRM